MRQPNTADQLQTGSQTGEICNWARITSFTSVKKSSLSKRLLNPKPTRGFPHTVDNCCGGFDIDWQNSTGNVVQPSVERQRTCWVSRVSLSRICYLSSDIIRCNMFVYIHLNALWWTLSGLRAQTSNSGNSKQEETLSVAGGGGFPGTGSPPRSPACVSTSAWPPSLRWRPVSELLNVVNLIPQMRARLLFNGTLMAWTRWPVAETQSIIIHVGSGSS